MLIDFHAHLADIKNVELAIRAAKKAGVERFVCPAMYKENNRAILKLAKAHKEIFPCIAIHPAYMKDLSDKDVAEELKFIEGNKEKAGIGEAGLDYMRLKKFVPEECQEAEKQRQIDTFTKQLKIAKKQNIPIIIHSRWAQDRVLQMVNDVKPKKVILHAFYPDEHQLKTIIQNGWFCSLGCAILETKDLDKSIAELPLNLIITETDCPYHAKGPEAIKDMVNRIAEIKGVSFKEIEEQVEKNFKVLFG